MASFIIADADPATATENMRTGGAFGSEVGSADDYRTLFEHAGFADIEIEDLTAEYHATLHAWLAEWSDNRDELEAVAGTEQFEERQAMRIEGIAAVESGSRTRFLVTATRL